MGVLWVFVLKGLDKITLLGVYGLLYFYKICIM